MRQELAGHSRVSNRSEETAPAGSPPCQGMQRTRSGIEVPSRSRPQAGVSRAAQHELGGREHRHDVFAKHVDELLLVASHVVQVELGEALFGVILEPGQVLLNVVRDTHAWL